MISHLSRLRQLSGSNVNIRSEGAGKLPSDCLNQINWGLTNCYIFTVHQIKLKQKILYSRR